MKLCLPHIYPITDTRLSGLSHTEQTRRLIAGGATLIQLREKHASPLEFCNDAERAVTLAHEHGAQIIINDRVDIALAVRADGVHLGQDDMPPDPARQLLGPDVIIGYSTHSVEQAMEAVRLPVDYIAVGPVFTTTTKENADDVVGLDGLRCVRSSIGDIPLTAIGGITAETLPEVIAAGADAAAIIADIVADPDRIAERTRSLLDVAATVPVPSVKHF